MNEDQVQEIVAMVATRFRTFGGGAVVEGNPIAAALKNAAPQFAAGIDVEEVVRAVLEAASITIS